MLDNKNVLLQYDIIKTKIKNIILQINLGLTISSVFTMKNIYFDEQIYLFKR